jgi:uncharacterized protein (DUF58 family)
MLISNEILKKVRRIHITTSNLVTDVFAGHYQSVFKGKGLGFDEVREYHPGDDIRSIDWNVTARMGHPYVKKYTEERELTIMFLLDLSSSCYFGTVHQLKRDLAIELCALLSFSANKNNDRVGFISFTDRVETFIPPRKGTSHVLRIIRDALYTRPEGQGTDLSLALEFLNKVTTRRTVAFILSDFYASDFDKALRVASKRHDLIAITLLDPAELTMPDLGMVKLEDPETGKSFLIDTSDPKSRSRYHQNTQERTEERKRLFNSIHVDHMDIRTDVAYLPTLIQFFRKREKRYGR